MKLKILLEKLAKYNPEYEVEFQGGDDFSYIQEKEFIMVLEGKVIVLKSTRG